MAKSRYRPETGTYFSSHKISKWFKFQQLKFMSSPLTSDGEKLIWKHGSVFDMVDKRYLQKSYFS